MTRQLVGQVNSLVSPPLWHHDDTTDLLHLGVVWWTRAIQVACNLEKHSAPSVSIDRFFHWSRHDEGLSGRDVLVCMTIFK